MSPRLLVIIVNYRTAPLVIDCLRSLDPEVSALPGAGASVVIVDNASRDDSVAQLGAAIASNGWGTWASLMPLADNRGFSAGNNAAIRPDLALPRPADFYLLLNPDTVVRPGALTSLMLFMSEHPRAGIAGSRLENPDGTAQCSAHRMITPVSELLDAARLGLLSRVMERHVVSPPLEPHEAQYDWVSGASFMVRREVVAEVGLLDEGYFLYFDEVDYCRRAQRAGWDVWYVPASRVVHLEGQATGIAKARQRRGRWWYDSRRRFFIKSYGVAGLIAADVLWAIGRLSLVIRRALRLGGDTASDPAHFSRDLLGGDIKALLTGGTRQIR